MSRRTLSFLTWRLGRVAVVGWLVCTLTFLLIRLVPGDPAELALGDLATPELLEALRLRMGLEGSILNQYATFLTGLVQGDLGVSIITNQPVAAMIARALPVTLWLVSLSFVMGIAVAVPLGLGMGLRADSRVDRIYRVVSTVSLATPNFFTGLIAIHLFAIGLGMFPVGGYDPDFPQNIQYLVLPALVNCAVIVPILSRVLRGSVIEVGREEFVEAAITRGVPRRSLYWRHFLRPALAPMIGLLGYMVGQGLSASVLTEIVFGLPGVGTTLVDGVLRRDYPLVQGITLILAIAVVAVNLGADVLNGLIDPRTRASA